ncbi:MAG: HAD hydrolase family protein [Rhodobacteraceae bacterium]|nr:HAD hydrolase family protein [Paracoccaceae bacterium]
MKDKNLILATDLDGTFLGGSHDQRSALYRWLENNRRSIGLIFVTGRDPRFIEQLCHDDAVPWPDYVVGDVGTTIAEVISTPSSNGATPPKTVQPLARLEAEIASLWNDAGSAIRALLDGLPGLTLQNTPFRYRVSYDFDPEKYDGRAEQLVKQEGYDVLISDNRYFDVLPPNVSKGPSLKRLLQHLDIGDETVLVAGDTLNDFSLFETGLRGVAVSNSEPALIERLGPIASAYKASLPGAGGIAEAIGHYKFAEQLEAIN